jgi:hypothetical protein
MTKQNYTIDDYMADEKRVTTDERRRIQAEVALIDKMMAAVDSQKNTKVILRLPELTVHRADNKKRI